MFAGFKKPRHHALKEGITLTGNVQAKPAAADEERFAIALTKRGLTFWFRLNPTNVPTGLPGWVELDFLVETTGLKTMQKAGMYKAIEIDDLTFVHSGQRKHADMVLKDQKRLFGLAQKGILLPEIEHIDAALLTSVKDADKLVKKLFG